MDYATLSEFAAYMRLREERRDKWDWYLAQIAAYCSGKESWKLSEFLSPVDDDNEPIKLDNPVKALAQHVGAEGA